MQEQAIKEKVKERYAKISLAGNSESSCAPTNNWSSRGVVSGLQMAKNIGYDVKELEDNSDGRIMTSVVAKAKALK
ncbi:MAG: hypothetical protein WAM14_17835 [Candidatus Nitrosopolaris sp.]